jgi:excisionase family DNA binding protein
MPNSSDSLNAREASVFLNAHVETVRRQARKGNIPSFKIGKDWRFRKEDLIKWSQSHHLRSQAPAVLVVDDESSIRSFVRKIFQAKGFMVFEADNGKRGLQYIDNETVNLILLDLKMPEMNGAEFLAELRGKKINIPVVLITGYPESHLIQDAMQYSPLLLMAKPLDRKKLLDTVGAVIHIPG